MRLSILLLFSLISLAGYAQANEPSEQCRINISLFNESAKNKQYADAVAPWKAAYAECPDAQRAIYTRGREIIHYLLSQSKDDKSYKENFDLLMEMYDSRIKYFGNDKRYPTPWILGLKALDYITFSKGDELKKQAYEWLEGSINGMGERVELEVLKQFLLLSSNIYKAEPAHANKFIADYLKTTELLDAKSKNPASKTAEIASQMKQHADLVFVQSGAADCATLNNIYKDQIEANLNNLEFLNNVLSFYRKVGCTEEELYFNVAIAAHSIQPTSESANACAQMAYKKKEFNKAIEFYEEAVRLNTDNAEKSELQYKIALVIFQDLKNYPRSRQAARKALELNPKNGKPYILIGLLYAYTKDLHKDPVLDKTVFWAAVDKFNKAKQVDSNLSGEANDLIKTYSLYFPTKDDIFFKQELNEGQPYTVGGWIGETTTARAAKEK